MSAILSLLKNLLGKKFITTVVGGFLTAYLVTWNSAHGNPLTPDQLTTAVGAIVTIIIVFLGLQTSADTTTQLANSVPVDVHAATVKALAASTPPVPVAPAGTVTTATGVTTQVTGG